MKKKNPYLNDRDILDNALEHSWGNTADAKAKERAYNREYYQRHKEEILRKARQAGEGIQRTAQNVANKVAGPYTTRAQQGLRSAGYNVQSKLYGTAADALNRAKSAPISINTRGTDPRQVLDNMNSARQRMRQRQRQYGTAANEAAKASRQPTPAGMALSRARANVEDVVGGIGRKIENAKMATYPGRRPGDHAPSYQDVERYRNAHVMNKRLVNEANDRIDRANVNERKASSKYDRLSKSSNANYAKAEQEFRRSVDLNTDPRTRGYARDAKNDAINYERKGKTYGDMAANAARESLEASREVDRAKANQRRMMNRRAASGAALNEAEKANRVYSNGAYDIKYDSKLARDLQNTKAKARGAMSKAEKAARQAREDAKKRMQKWFGHSDYSYKKK